MRHYTLQRVVVDYLYGIVTVLEELRKIAEVSSYMWIFEARS